MKSIRVDSVTTRNLEISRVLASVAGHASCGPARERVLAFEASMNGGELRKRRARVGETMRLCSPEGNQGPGLPPSLDLSFLDELETLFARLERGGTLYGEEILAVTALIGPLATLSDLVTRHRDSLEALHELMEDRSLASGATLEGLKRIALEVDASLDESGRVKDTASPELRRLRRKAVDLRGHLSARAQQLVLEHAEHLQDDFFTIREDRYVLPVRSDSRRGVPGIIHGSSNSGATLFVEPHALVEDCNELKVLEGEIHVRENEILEELSGALSRHVAGLRRTHQALVEMDVLLAIARFALAVEGGYPELVDEPVLDLRSARHPLLVQAGVDVVPNDVAIRSGTGWVVSGPNAGGKTVLIKTVALTVLMSYMGLPVSLGPGSVVGRFDHLHAEIGDAQSIEANLSTFSAQVASLSKVIGAVGPSSLVVLDELAAGTDPDEGAALAEAVIAEMLDGGAAVLVATHFESLKRMSIENERLVAAGMGLDLQCLEPTFRLHVGMPGSSGGLLVAERFGMPTRVIIRARGVLETGHSPEQAGRLEALERLKEDLEAKLQEAEQLETRLRSREIKLERKERELTESRKRSLTAEQRFLTTELTVLRSELKHAHKVLRRRPLDSGHLKSPERVARKVGQVLAPDGPIARSVKDAPDARPLGNQNLQEGETVVVPSLGLTGRVLRVEGRKVRIDRDGVSWAVDLDKVQRPGKRGQAPGGSKEMDDDNGPVIADEQEEGYQSPYNTIDVRGKGLDEAQIDLDTFLDEAREMGMEQVFVIHGHGTGILKNGLRRYMRHLKKVKSFRPGKRDEGGDGVTVATLES